MDTTRAQQKALDDDLVAPANRLHIGKWNLKLCLTLKSKEPTIQVVFDALKLTSFYKEFKITTDVQEIYMQEDMLKIFPKLPGQKFEDPPLEEEILSFIRDLGHTGDIKFLFDVNVNHMHQPWRSFAAIINKCLSGKTTALENLVYQVENKNSKKNNDMYYPRFTKVIVNYFMAKDLTTQIYGAILPQHLTNQAMLESKAYKTYHAYATGEKIPKPKYVKNKVDSESSPKKKSAQASKGKRIKTSTKIKLATKRSLIQTHSSHASGLGADKGTGVILGVPDVPTYNSNDEQISWKSNDKDGDAEVHVSEDEDNQNDDDADNEDDDN
ncbi:hypothetical protein Tco_0659283 [Tanacetum coccineum]